MLDSLVRVSRRVNENHFVRISNTASGWPSPVTRTPTRTTLLSKADAHARNQEPKPSGAYFQSSIRHTVALTGFRLWSCPLRPTVQASFLPRSEFILTHPIPQNSPPNIRSPHGVLRSPNKLPLPGDDKYGTEHDWFPVLPS
jgi:hypothetical protein